ncbi:arylsulfatase [Prescottella agglutinans]|uniref:Arylsulfatase n=1 Tax=Prescottella agglutinans TaxID=1644129 RepID=A0A438BBU7_9NOCA|nr:sulfatase-like hydrolase/transferase [Prescottella agglutinans]RVW08498.1 arylsulfatase [Prescottella agglutinans]
MADGSGSTGASNRPNIVYFHVDNLGFGEISCYSGGPFRGAWTRRIDAFAEQGTRLTNFAPEAQCTPTRSAFLTGRYSVRSGTHSVPIGVQGGWGLVAWERTLGDQLSEAGYRCAVYGKWHVGEGPGHWPTDHGFVEWSGPPRTYDESLWPDDPWYDPTRDPVSRMVTIAAGDDDVTEGEQMTQDVRRDVDVDYLARTDSFIRTSVAEREPFFLYFNHSMMHMPVIPRREFAGQSGMGDWADSLLELDSDFGTVLDLLDELGISDNTLVVFAGDNGPEEMLPWRGSPGYWEGSYFAGGEGNLRTPCIVRWPRRIGQDRVSNDIMHVTDWFTTLLSAAGAKVPSDRVIDGVDQLPWLTGRQEASARDGYPYWMGAELYGVKWRDFKVVMKTQKLSTDEVGTLAAPHIINLITDPQEREPFNYKYLHSWVAYHAGRILGDYKASLAREPLIPAGAPIDHVPVHH